MKRIALETLGCKLNQAETELLARQLLSKGYQLTESPQEADIYVLNTCTVTHISDRKARNLLRSAHRCNPNAMIIATGCYAQRAPGELKEMGIVDLIMDNREKGHLIGVIESRLGTETSSSPKGWERTRSLVKIQEGCNNFCSFCIVPYSRGKEISLSADEVLESVRSSLAAGHKEVVLTGTKIGAYEQQSGGQLIGLSHLMERVLKETEVERLRLSSVQPQELTPDLLELWADDRLCRHLHIPLQSGSEAILKSMGRQYSIHEYEQAVIQVRKAIPDIAVTTDILVGYPGESEKEFDESYQFCEKIGFANIHVFPYSLRLGTRAATMPDQVEEKVRKERSQKMLKLAKRSAQQFKRQFIGRTVPVLWESKIEQDSCNGLTSNYLRVFTRTEEDLTGMILPVKLIADHTQGLLGELVDSGNLSR